jgi:hypothetical protein
VNTDATDCLPVVIAAQVFVANIAQMSRFALNAALSRQRRALLTCMNLIRMKNKTLTLIQ